MPHCGPFHPVIEGRIRRGSSSVSPCTTAWGTRDPWAPRQSLSSSASSASAARTTAPGRGAALWVPGSACPQLSPSPLCPPPYLGVPGEPHVPPPVPAQRSLPGATVAEVIEGLSLHHLRAQKAAVSFSRGHQCQPRVGCAGQNGEFRVSCSAGPAESVTWRQNGVLGRACVPLGVPRSALHAQRPFAQDSQIPRKCLDKAWSKLV